MAIPTSTPVACNQYNSMRFSPAVRKLLAQARRNLRAVEAAIFNEDFVGPAPATTTPAR